jgi:hypothetical protein
MGTGAENARVDWLGFGSFVGVMWCTVRTFGLSFASAGQLGVYYSHRGVNRVFRFSAAILAHETILLGIRTSEFGGFGAI